MSAIVNISSVSAPLPAASTTLTNPTSHPARSRASGEDTVELSWLGRAFASATGQSSLDLARTRAIRADIQAGTFETTERLDGTVEQLLDVLG